MKYTNEYVRKIAEFKFGAGSRSVASYVRKFDPADPTCAKDELLWVLSLTSDENIAEARLKMRVENYFIDHLLYNFYRREWNTLYDGFSRKDPAEKSAEEFAKRMKAWLSASFTDAPAEAEEGENYLGKFAAFGKKYGVNLSPETVMTAVTDIAALDAENRIPLYRRYFKGIFLASYLKTNGKAKIDAMFADFDSVMTSVMNAAREAGQKISLPPRGGMAGAAVRDYLVGIRRDECDLTHKAKESLKDVGHTEATVRVQEQFGYILSDKKMPEKEKLARCVSLLQALESKHSLRSTVRRITSPSRFRQESRTIAGLKRMLTERKFDSADIERLSVGTVYLPAYEKDVGEIEAFCQKLDDMELDGGLLPDEPSASENGAKKEPVSFDEEIPEVLKEDEEENLKISDGLEISSGV